MLRSLAAQGVDTSSVQLLRVPGLSSPRSSLSDAIQNHIPLETCLDWIRMFDLFGLVVWTKI